MEYVKNITQLVDLLGTSRQTFYNYKDALDAPKHTHKGYDVEAWRQYFTDKNIPTKETRASQQELKARLTQCDIELRKIEIEKQRGKLVAKDEAIESIKTLANMYIQFLQTIPSYLLHQNEDIKKIGLKMQQDGCDIINSKIAELLKKKG